MVDVGHAAALGLFADRVLRGTLGAHEQDAPAVGGELADVVNSILVERQALFEVDDMNLVAVAEDIGSHLRIPVPRLVAEMHAGLQHLAHGHFRHVCKLLVVG